MKCWLLRNYETRNRSWKFSEFCGPIAVGECILFSPSASLEDGFSPPFLGPRRSLLLASHSLAWDSHALSPHMTAACTRLPNAYNATLANGAICGKSFPSNLSFSLTLLSSLFHRRSLPFSRSHSRHSRHSAHKHFVYSIYIFFLYSFILLHTNFIYTGFIQFVTFTYCQSLYCCFFSSLLLRKVTASWISSTNFSALAHF